MLDWKLGHKQNCGRDGPFFENEFLFHEFELVCEEVESGKEIEEGEGTDITPDQADAETDQVDQSMKDVDEKELENEDTIAKVTFDTDDY